MEKGCEFKGEIVTADSPSYNQDRQGWNRGVQKFPKIIFYCTNEEDIKYAIKYCRDKDIPIRIRSGGHNYEGYSVGDGVGVIDISRYTNLEINECENKLKVTGGVKLKNVYEFVGEKGYPFPGGTCPTVCATGLTLGGGWGVSARLFGLTCDSLVEAELIDYRGEKIVANKRCNRDLFWALRGGGSENFGVVTALTYNLPPKFNKVTVFNLYYPKIDANKQADILNIWQNNIRCLDRRVNMLLRIYNSEVQGQEAYMKGMFYGEKEELKRILKPFLDYGKNELIADETTFLKGIKIMGAGYGPYEKFKTGGRFVYETYDYSTLYSLAKSLEDRAEGSKYAEITVYGLGGAVSDKESDETAFYYRGAKYIMAVKSNWEDNKYAKVNEEWVGTRFNLIRKITTGSYINFIYAPQNAYGIQYYGKNSTRLKEIKRRYDPLNVFTYPQGIK